jgi:hypothetical protein
MTDQHQTTPPPAHPTPPPAHTIPPSTPSATAATPPASAGGAAGGVDLSTLNAFLKLNGSSVIDMLKQLAHDQLGIVVPDLSTLGPDGKPKAKAAPTDPAAPAQGSASHPPTTSVPPTADSPSTPQTGAQTPPAV